MTKLLVWQETHSVECSGPHLSLNETILNNNNNSSSNNNDNDNNSNKCKCGFEQGVVTQSPEPKTREQCARRHRFWRESGFLWREKNRRSRRKTLGVRLRSTNSDSIFLYYLGSARCGVFLDLGAGGKCSHSKQRDYLIISSMQYFTCKTLEGSKTLPKIKSLAFEIWFQLPQQAD